MTEQTIYSALKNVFTLDIPQRLLCVGGEEWSRMLFLYGVEEQVRRTTENKTARVHFEKISFESLNEEFQTPVLSFYAPMKASYYRIETAKFEQKEAELFQKAQVSDRSCLVWFTDTLIESVAGSVHLQKCKPWEKESLARDVVTLLLQMRQVASSPSVVLILANSALTNPAFFASDMEKYCHYAAEGIIQDSDIESLIGHDATPTSWSLLEAFLLRNKKAFFEGLSCVEEQGETHPLPLIRFFRSQLEKFILASESGISMPFKSQERQKEAVSEMSLEAKRILIHELLTIDSQLRDGTFDEKNSLVPFFLTLWSRIS